MKKIVFFFTLLISVNAFSTRYLVDLGSGNTWTDPTASGGTRIDLSTVNGGSDFDSWFNITAMTSVDEVWVAGGIYVVNAKITLKDGVDVYGSFAGTETSTTSRSMASVSPWDFTYKTEIDGNNGADYMAFSIANATVETVFDGFTMKNYNTTTSVNGVICDIIGTITVQNCIFNNNKFYPPSASKSGGMYIRTGVKVLNSWIHHNQSITANTYIASGGAFSMAGPCTVKGCTIEYNSASAAGGAINCLSNGTTNSGGGTIEDCIIRFNVSSGSGGGIYYYPSNATPTAARTFLLKNCQITDNKATKGGGLMINGHSATNGNIYTHAVEGSTFARDTATTEDGGGISFNLGATSVLSYLKNCTFRDNIAKTEGSAFWTRKVSTFYNNIIVNNSVVTGAVSAVYVNAASSKIYNNTFANNYGVALKFGAVATCEAKNNIFWNNTDNTITDGTSPDKNFNAYRGATGADAGANSVTTLDATNTFISPTSFTGAAVGDTQKSESNNANWNLKSSGNPAINAGADLASAGVTTDILGNSRPTGTGAVDMGAYEGIFIADTKNISTYATNSDINISTGGHLTVDATKTVKSISVAAGGKLTVNAAITASNGITLESDATGTATLLGSAGISGTVTAKQYLGSARNWYVSSPVSSVSAPASNIDYYYEYVEAGDNDPDGQPGSSTAYWKGLSNGHSMAVGKGYIAKANAGTTISFSGTPNNGDIETAFNLTRDDNKGKGFNLAGNPYPSYIDWVDVATANPNLDNTYYYRTKNTNLTNTYTFVTWNGAGSSYVVSNGSLPANTAITRFIPPTQAFWVRVKTGTSTTKMNFNNGMREHRDDDNNLMKAPKQDTRTSLRLQLLNGTDSDELLIYQDAGASNSYDSYDSHKMMNNSSSVPDLYSIAGDEQLVINGLNSITDNMELPLGFSLNAAAPLKLKANEMSNFPTGTRIFLLDKVESSQLELLPETEYSFTTTAVTTNNESRFSLLFRAPGVTTGVGNAENFNAQVFVNAANQITIVAPEKCSYSIYNAVGQMLTSGFTKADRTIVQDVTGAGVYLIQITENGNKLISKLIIR